MSLLLAASSVIFSNVCQWYITQFAHGAVKDHVLTVVQNNLITLNWSRFVPNLVDIELMLKVSSLIHFPTSLISDIFSATNDGLIVLFLGN